MTSVVAQQGAASNEDIGRTSAALARNSSERPTASRVRELLVVIAALAAVAGIGALMVACTTV